MIGAAILGIVGTWLIQDQRYSSYSSEDEIKYRDSLIHVKNEELKNIGMDRDTLFRQVTLLKSDTQRLHLNFTNTLDALYIQKYRADSLQGLFSLEREYYGYGDDFDIENEEVKNEKHSYTKSLVFNEAFIDNVTGVSFCIGDCFDYNNVFKVTAYGVPGKPVEQDFWVQTGANFGIPIGDKFYKLIVKQANCENRTYTMQLIEIY